jgi:hypothetical protein
VVPSKCPRQRWYHILMKLFCSLLCSVATLAAVAFANVNPQLHEVKRVYILAMGGGMDQFLVGQLTKAGVFEVVTDPKKADAIVTDNVGEGFQTKLDDLYPPPPPPHTDNKKTEVAATKPAADPGASVDVGNTTPADPKGSKDQVASVDFGGVVAHSSSFGRGKGNFFVVDRNSRIVLWSVYERPKNSTPGELTKTAERVVKHLKEDLAGKKAAE